MDVKYDTNRALKATQRAQALAAASEQYKRAKDELDQHYAQMAPSWGMGKDALVQHVQADAHHGKTTQELVTSRVVNVYAGHTSHEPMLRIQLGKTNGELGSQYAFLDVSAVKRVVERSAASFNAMSGVPGY